MNDHHRCAFSLSLINNEHACRHATPITRRGGPDIACAHAEASARCAALFDYIKEVSLPELGFSDSLTEMPHSAQIKMQCGGLAGLAALSSGPMQASPRIPDIAALAEELILKFGTPHAIPASALAAAVSAYKLKRRR